MRLLIMGPPGAGKGTQARLLATALGIPTISTGQIFRSHVQRGTELGQEVQRLIEAGDYVPDSLVERIVAERLTEPDAAGGFLLDGFPRTVHQAEALQRLMGEAKLDAVISLDADTDDLVARMLHRAEVEGRADDTEETIRHRMAVYEEATEPLLNHYRTLGVLVPIDGHGTVDEVAERIQAKIVPLRSTSA